MPGRRERGYALLDAVIALGIVALLALLAFAGFARGALRAHAAAVTFAALIARVEAAASDAALRNPLAPAASGLTVTLRAGDGGTDVGVYRGRPGPDVALPLQTEPAFAPVSLAGVTVRGLPFSIFFGGSGSVSEAAGFDAATARHTLPTEPGCPAGREIEVVLRDEFRAEAVRLSCADGRLR